MIVIQTNTNNSYNLLNWYKTHGFILGGKVPCKFFSAPGNCIGNIFSYPNPALVFYDLHYICFKTSKYYKIFETYEIKDLIRRKSLVRNFFLIDDRSFLCLNIVCTVLELVLFLN